MINTDAPAALTETQTHILVVVFWLVPACGRAFIYTPLSCIHAMQTN